MATTTTRTKRTHKPFTPTPYTPYHWTNTKSKINWPRAILVALTIFCALVVAINLLQIWSA
jgi:hypothetical protein